MAQNRDSFFLAKKSDQPKNTEKVKSGRVDKKFVKKSKIHPEQPKTNAAEGTEKKPFDKKTYRLKKYSNKYKLEKWEDQRKKKLLRTYYKDVKNEAPSGNYKPINFDEVDNSEDEEDRITVKDIPEGAIKNDAGNHDLKSNAKTIGRKHERTQTENESTGRFVRHPDLIEKIDAVSEEKEQNETRNSKTIKKDAFWKAKAEFSRLKQNKQQQKKETNNTKQQREEKLAEYRKKKAERFKKLSKKTKKGQPVMTGRLELLLEKIMKNK